MHVKVVILPLFSAFSLCITGSNQGLEVGTAWERATRWPRFNKWCTW